MVNRLSITLLLCSSAAFAQTVTITSPANQTILTQSVSFTLMASAPTAASLQFTVDGTPLGSATNAGGGVWTYAWTPGSVDYNASLTAVANGGAYTSAPLVIVVAEANTISTNFSTWSPGGGPNPTVTSGQSDPDGGTGAYRITMPVASSQQVHLAKAASGSPSTFNSGFEIWAKTSNSIDVYLAASEDAIGHSCYLDPSTDQTNTTNTWCKIVQTSSGWSRIWFNYTGATTAGPKTFFIYFTNGLTSNSATFAGTETITLYAPRTAQNGTLPFTNYQKLGVYKSGTSGNAEIWTYTGGGYITTGSVRQIFTLKPTGWTNTGTYKALFPLSALPYGNPGVPLNTENTPGVFDAGGYANAFNCVIIIPYGANTQQPWWAATDTGAEDEYNFFLQQVVPFATEFIGASPLQFLHRAVGYSKSGNALVGIMLRGPGTIDRAAVWDAPFEASWVTVRDNYGGSAAFVTQANWMTYNPENLLPADAPAVQDKTRLAILGCYFFCADQATFAATLASDSVPNYYNQTMTASHSWSSGWLPSAVGWVMNDNAGSSMGGNLILRGISIQ